MATSGSKRATGVQGAWIGLRGSLEALERHLGPDETDTLLDLLGEWLEHRERRARRVSARSGSRRRDDRRGREASS